MHYQSGGLSVLLLLIFFSFSLFFCIPFVYFLLFISCQCQITVSTLVVWKVKAKGSVSGFEIAPPSKGGGCNKLLDNRQKLKAKQKTPIILY